ncbi:unnamed protein product [Rotaria sordida]|uniref:Uncharacterized protein n=1 Tax=Rotaria sordida TaxID=392033 RepID=A0A820CXK8_9BILA|nr:unnamed protein product [Rotaria sordida]
MLMPPKNEKVIAVHIKLLHLAEGENQGSSGQRRGDGTGDKEVLNTANKLAEVLPYRHCHLKQLRFERIKDNLLLEEEFIKNQERLKPQEDRHEEERSKVDHIWYDRIFIFQ